MIDLEEYSAEIIYTIKDDLNGKYIEHGLKVGDTLPQKLQKLYYIAMEQKFIENMDDSLLLSTSERLDKEINKRFGTGEPMYIKDGGIDVTSCKRKA